MSTNVSAITSGNNSPDTSFSSSQQRVGADDHDSNPRPNQHPPNVAPAPAVSASSSRAQQKQQPAAKPETPAAASQQPQQQPQLVTPRLSYASDFVIDSPPPPIQSQKSSGASSSAASAATTTKILYPIDTCLWVDTERVLSDISKLQHEVAKLSLRMDLHDDRATREAAHIGRLHEQLGEYTASLGVVSKWASTVGGQIPRFLRSMATAATVVEPAEVLIRSEAPSAVHLVAPLMSSQQQQQQEKDKENVSVIAAGCNDPQQRHTASAAPPSVNASSIYPAAGPAAAATSGAAALSATAAAYIPISEVRAMFSTFRDEIVRLKERNAVLEQRLDEALTRFEGSSLNKLKADVEGRLRTMLHSLHETMNGSSSSSSGASASEQMMQQVSALRTEVELVKGKTEAATSSRAVLEARVSDLAAKVRDLTDGQLERSRHEQQLAVSQREELRDLRTAMKELGLTVSQRLDSERSAREFEAGDIRSQLRVLLRSPSPMARVHMGDPRTPSTAIM
jgi:hypothetical protein